MNARLGSLVVLLFIAATVAAQEPIAPKETIKLFNGKDLTGLTTWLKDTQRDDPRKVFSVKDGILHVSGDGLGYIATDKEYRDYHLTVEYNWGKKTDGGKHVRNSGILLHAIGPDGGAGKTWMSCIECQLAQGCVGDLIVIRGHDGKSGVIPVKIFAETALGSDKHPRWKAGGEVRLFERSQLWWHKHEAGFKELIDTRGKDDVESPLGEWTKVECICKDKTIEIRVNGTTVNKAFDVFPAAGKILLQTEGFEIDFRRFEVQPLKAAVKVEEPYAKVEIKGKLSRLGPRDRYDRPPEVHFVYTGKVSCALDFGDNKDFLELARKSEGKSVIVSGTLEMRAPHWPGAPMMGGHQTYVVVKTLKIDND